MASVSSEKVVVDSFAFSSARRRLSSSGARGFLLLLGRPGRRLREGGAEHLGREGEPARSQPYYLDVTHPEANKGTVVATLSKRLGIPPEQIATIGDMPNDVLMFRKSGFSIAMGNSSDEVKAQASAVTDSNENEGFAKAVRNFVLVEPSRHHQNLQDR